MKEEKGKKINNIIIGCIYLAKISELLNMKLITEDEYNKIKIALKIV